ncbi:aerobic C4-dicarboxylate transport protein [Chishuiella changwenlii]|jgi:aerobic C4-dicarboxylate transport protein|uniref:C4-dicarboxylate transport protein n=1 Tax=Chishuiella changwenlii TaxID=1434701 RepID=A0A1M7A3S2_9FLAO|nr:dicarboxylate/amino acid:cation symporter [Chishuiella changwenlii]GGE91724.1 C4-dicarboxylate transport protein [Chishuiella changwenlii]SHL37364.1 aerobic C4-dicarboxylate transport protein [Chishuiella changwenlii]
MNIDLDQVQERKPKKFYQLLYVQVIFAIILGVALGYYYPSTGEKMQPLGDGFIKLVKMIIAPVIFLTVSTGIAGMNDLKKVGRVAGKAFAYFIFFSTLALIVGLVVSHYIQPGKGLNINPEKLDASQITKYVKAAEESDLKSFVFNIIPDSLFQPLTGDIILQVLFVAIMFGIGLALTADRSKPVIDLLNTCMIPVFKVVELLMKLAPIGAFGAIAFTIGKFGIDSLKNLFGLVLTFYFTSFLFVTVILGFVAKMNGFNIFKFIYYIKEEVFLVLGTSSSEPALPGMMQKLTAMGCEKSVVGLVIPTGYSFNLDGTNIYMTLAALFIAQACNIDLSVEQMVILLGVAILSSKGAAGVTGAGFITLAATLAVVPDIPIAGMTLILGIDKFMSECRALTNVIGNGVATVVVSNWEGQLDKEQMKKVLNNN